MRSLPLSSLSSAASSPAGATLPAIRTEYAGSTFKPCFAADGDDTTPIKQGLVARLASEPVSVPVVGSIGDEAGSENPIADWIRANCSTSDLSTEPDLLSDDDFGITPEQLMADLRVDAVKRRITFGVVLMVGAAILITPFAGAFGWF